MVCFAAAIILILTLALCWRWENARRDRVYGPASTATVELDDDGKGNTLEQPVELTDIQNHNFRYVY